MFLCLRVFSLHYSPHGTQRQLFFCRRSIRDCRRSAQKCALNPFIRLLMISNLLATTILFVRWSQNQKMPSVQISCAMPAAGCQYSVDNINMVPFFWPLCPTLVVKIHDIQVSLCKTSCILLTISIWSQNGGKIS